MRCLESENRIIVIYGAGARGKMIANILTQSGIEKFLFCDRNRELIGKLVHGKECIAPEQMYKNSEKYFVLITPSNTEEIENELLRNGFQPEKNFVNYSKALTSCFMEFFDREQENGVLLLGDCYWVACDANSENKACLYDELESYIEKEKDINRLAMNALTISEYYWIFRAYIEKGNRPDIVMVSVDIRNFNGVNHMLPGVQHVDLIEKISEKVYVEGLAEHIEEKTIKSEKGMPVHHFADKQVEQWTRERNEIKLNYCYRWKSENEEMMYLIKLIDAINKMGAIPALIFLPVNFETAKEEFEIDFMDQYEKNKQKVMEGTEAYAPYIIDLSYRVGREGFSGIKCFNEILGEADKKIIAEEIYKKYKRLISK